MGRFASFWARGRDAPKKKRSAGGTSPAIAWLASPEAYSTLVGAGYTRLVDCPEVQTAVNRIADMISNMTIHLMENTDDGDRRIKNGLSRRVDIAPNVWTTRKQLVYSIVRNMMLDGRGNAVVLPRYDRYGYIIDLQPFDMRSVSFEDRQDYGYYIWYKGARYEPDEVLHFVDNPDPQRPWIGQGYDVLLRDAVKLLKQQQSTRKSLMGSPTPSIIVKVDALTEEFSSREGRDRLQRQFLDAEENGRPWMIPADGFEVEQVKPLSINDLAIKDGVAIDKRTIASVINVPPYWVGDGVFNREEHNNAISTTIMSKARTIEQELTRKLIYGQNWYFRFNPNGLYSYSITEISEVCCNLVDRAIMDRNEARDRLGMAPREGLSEMAILENYIPYLKIGDQQKLQQQGGDNGGNGKA